MAFKLASRLPGSTEAAEVPLQALTITAYNAYRSALSYAPPPWEEVSRNEAEVWALVAAYTLERTEEAEGRLWSDIAKEAFQEWMDAVDRRHNWTELPPLEKVAWEAFAWQAVTTRETQDIAAARARESTFEEEAQKKIGAQRG